MSDQSKEIKAIDLAIRVEDDAAAFYREAMEKAIDPRGKSMFRQLARFEEGHSNYLKQARDSLGEGGNYPVFEEKEFTKEDFGPPVSLESAARLNLIQVLTTAIEAERRAQGQYSQLARTASTEAGKEFFAKLVREEELHERILNDQFYSVNNQGQWSWGE